MRTYRVLSLKVGGDQVAQKRGRTNSPLLVIVAVDWSLDEGRCRIAELLECASLPIFLVV
jgi:hypothetical protein